MSCTLFPSEIYQNAFKLVFDIAKVASTPEEVKSFLDLLVDQNLLNKQVLIGSGEIIYSCVVNESSSIKVEILTDENPVLIQINL
jgi:hypothetical protein